MRFARTHRMFLLWLAVAIACAAAAPWNVVLIVVAAPWLVAVLWVTLRHGDGDPTLPPTYLGAQRRRPTSR